MSSAFSTSGCTPAQSTQIVVSTADEEANYFTNGTPLPSVGDNPLGAELPTGTYRIVAGQLFRILDLHAPFVERIGR